MELRYEELRIPSVYARSNTVDRCREPSDESRHEHCDNQSHSHRGWGDSSQETLPRLEYERERTTGSDQRNHRHERSIGMASVDHEIRAKHSAESTKSYERNPQCKDLSLRAHSIRDRSGRMARVSGDRFNVSMKKALFLDKAPSSVRVPLQMQNLANFEAMTAVTLQFLQHNAQYQAGVTVTPTGEDQMTWRSMP